MSVLKSKKLSIFGGAVALSLMLAGCGGTSTPQETASSETAETALTVVTTTTQLADVVGNIGGDLVEVSSLIEPNQSAHSFDPTAAQLQSIAGADILIQNGVGLEEWLDETIAASGFDGVTIDSSDGVELISTAEEEEEEHDHAEDEHDHAEEEAATDEHAEEEHDHGEYDPHIWTSPVNMVIVSENILSALTEADPANAATYEENAAAYVEQLELLDQWSEESINQTPVDERLLVSTHNAFGYFNERYDITFVGAVIPSIEDNAEPSAAEIAELVAEVKEHGAKAVFSEAAISPKAAEAIANEAGAEVFSGDRALYADSLGLPGSSAETYIGAQIHNVTMLVNSWGSEPVAVPEALQ